MLINCSTQVSTKKSLSRDIIMLINSRPNIAYLNHLGLRHALSVDSLSEDGPSGICRCTVSEPSEVSSHSESHNSTTSCNLTHRLATLLLCLTNFSAISGITSASRM